MNLDDEVRARGASDQNLTSKAYNIVKDIIAENNGEIPQGATGRADEIEEKLKEAAGMAEDILGKTQRVAAHYKEAWQSAEDSIRKYDEVGKSLKQMSVSDDRDIEALNVYMTVLKNSLAAIPGEKLTEAVICQILQSGSYMAWRSIMGPKSQSGDGSSDYPRYGRR